MITCQVCHKEFLLLPAHLSAHGLTTAQYLEQFPNAPLISNEFKRRAGMPARYKVNETFFDSWSPSMAYCLGLLIADGYILLHPRVKYKYIAGFALDSTDRELPLHIKQALGAEAPVKEITPVQNASGSVTVRYRINIHNHGLAKSLIALGCRPQKSNNLTMPNVPRNLMPYFSRGYFEGDGSIYRNRRPGRSSTEVILSFVTGSKTFANDFLKSLQTFDIAEKRKVYTSTNRRSKNPHYRLMLGKLDAAKFFRLAYADLMTCPYYLKRKYNKFLEIGLQDYYGRVY